MTEPIVPNVAIIRIPDVDGSKTFVQLPMDEDGFITGSDAKEFQVFDGDSYNLLEFNQIIMAKASDDGASSIELCRVTILDRHNNSNPVEVHTDPTECAIMVKQIFEDLRDGNTGDEDVPDDSED